jgi:hypothetical protein
LANDVVLSKLDFCLESFCESWPMKVYLLTLGSKTHQKGDINAIGFKPGAKPRFHSAASPSSWNKEVFLT